MSAIDVIIIHCVVPGYHHNGFIVTCAPLRTCDVCFMNIYMCVSVSDEKLKLLTKISFVPFHVLFLTLVCEIKMTCFNDTIL